MSDIDFRRDGKRISGSNGSSGYDEGNRLTIDGKTYYKDGNNRYYCPDDGKIYNLSNGHISTLEDGIIGTYDSNSAHIYKSNNTSNNYSFNNSKSSNIDSTTAMGIYYTIQLVKKHFIGILVFLRILVPIFVGIGKFIGDAYIGFAIGFVVSIFIAAGVEKVIKTFYNIIRYGHIKGKLFLIVSIFSVFFLLMSIYSIYEANDLITSNEQHMEEDPSYSKYATEYIENAENKKENYVQYCIVSTSVAIISGAIFVVRNQTHKSR